MPSHKRRPRLSWFRFYADDFIGGTGALSTQECGQYLLLLLHQWASKDQQAVPNDPTRLRLICRGEDPSPTVIAKFKANGIGLRNERLAVEWASAKHEYDAKAAGPRGQIQAQYQGQSLRQIVPPTKNQEPRAKIQESDVDPSMVVGREVVAPPRYEPTFLPAEKAENEVTDEIRRLQIELGGWLCKLSEHQKSDRMVPAWTRRVTSYDRKDGTKVNGVADYRTIRSIERLEKSIEDAKFWYAKLEAPNGA